MLVRVDAAEALEHLESFQRHGAIRRKSIRKQSAPYGMLVQNRTDSARAYDGKVEPRLRRGLPVPANHPGRLVNFQKLFRIERSFIQSGRRDREAQRPLTHDRAEISARSEHPSALVQTLPDPCKGASQILKACA